MKFIAVQMGARRGYAVPAVLEKAGMLERFYTELAGNVGWGRWLTAVPLPRVGQLRRLAARKIPEPAVAKTRTFGNLVAGAMFREWLGARDAGARFRGHLEFQERWGRAMIREGFGQATHVFSMLGEGGPFLSEAHRRGLTVVAETYILLATEGILKQERKEFPQWEPDAVDYGVVRQYQKTKDVFLERTHFYICPSEAVQEDLVTNYGIARERAALVPYGMDPKWLALDPQPQPGRVLFVGTADLRKGIHYLAMAAEQLRARGFTGEFRIAGNVTEQVRRQPVCRHLTFLGRVPRDRIHEEFQQADVFVLPSLAEGSAEVTYEALAAGVPLVVTKAAGSVVRNGVEGRIVPERDHVALAGAIEEIVEDRDLRARYASSARERARDFTWEKYGDRLVTTLRSLGGGR